MQYFVWNMEYVPGPGADHRAGKIRYEVYLNAKDFALPPSFQTGSL